MALSSQSSAAQHTNSSSGAVAADAWRAEEAVAGNSEALQALRELISYPLLYSRESKILGLKVQLRTRINALPLEAFWLSLINFLLILQWPRGLLLHGPPGTGKVCKFIFIFCYLWAYNWCFLFSALLDEFGSSSCSRVWCAFDSY